jgi:hypothetical protein
MADFRASVTLSLVVPAGMLPVVTTTLLVVALKTGTAVPPRSTVGAFLLAMNPDPVMVNLPVVGS